MISTNFDIYSVVSYINNSFNFISDASLITHNHTVKLADESLFRGDDIYHDTMLIVDRIILKVKFDFEKTYNTKECIDSMISNLDILEHKPNEEEVSKINFVNNILKYIDKIDNLDQLYGMSKVFMLKYIMDDINKYSITYGHINPTILDTLISHIDTAYRQLGILLFDYGKRGKAFEKLYNYYYYYGGSEYKELYDQFGLIISCMKFLHKNTNYSTEEIRAVCDNLKKINTP